ASGQKKGQPIGLPFCSCSGSEKLPAVAAAAVAVAAAAAAEVIALRHRLGFVDGQGAPVELRAVQAVDRLLRLAAGAHLDEAEAARLPGKFVGDHAGRLNRPVLRKDFLQSVV